VDDEPDSLRLLKFVLEKGGATVHTAENASTAYEEARAWHPDLIVSDISMPGESGYDLLKRIRELPAEDGGAVPAFALTAYAGAEDKQKVFDAGYQRHFSKPINTQALLASIREFSPLH
jgi:CheY-like chemotaxis protein